MCYRRIQLSLLDARRDANQSLEVYSSIHRTVSAFSSLPLWPKGTELEAPLVDVGIGTRLGVDARTDPVVPGLHRLSPEALP